MYFYRILPRNITKECMNVKHGLLLVWGEERIGLLEDVLSILPAWSDFDTMKYDSSVTGNLFMVISNTANTVLKKHESLTGL